MPLTIQEYEELRFERNAQCLRRCGTVGREKVHEWCDEEGFVSEAEAIERLHRVATVESEGGPREARHQIFRLNADGTVTHMKTVSTAQGFYAFSPRLGEALACRCCRHPLLVIKGSREDRKR